MNTRTIFCLLFATALILLESRAPAQNTYEKSARNLQKSIQTHFVNPENGFYLESAIKTENRNPASYLWPLCALIQADVEMARLASADRGLEATLSLIEKYRDTRPPAPGYASYVPALGGGDRFYDDNQWIGIALMDAWLQKPVKKYLDISEEIYRFMMTASDTLTGGGLYWEEGKPTKNTCSNGPGIILAMQLHKATGNKKYLKTATDLYQWVNRYLRDPEGLYYDNMDTRTRRVDEKRYSYNTGTMIQSGLYLFEATGDRKYLELARQSARSAATYFLGNSRFRDGYWFNAVLLRAYQHLLSHDSEKQYIGAFRACTDQALTGEVNGQGLMQKGTKPVGLVDQAGMLEILLRLALLQR